MRLPQDQGGYWVQFKSYIGNLWSTFGVNLTEVQGKIRIAVRFMINTSSDTGLTGANGDADLGVPIAFVRDLNGPGTNWYALVTGVLAFVGTLVPNGAFAQDTATNTISGSASRPDMKSFNGFIYVANGGLKKLASGGGSWGDVTVTGNATNGPLIVFANRLYFLGNSSLKTMWSIDTSDTAAESGQYTINLASASSSFIASVICGAATNSAVWLGCLAENENGRGVVFKWDGSSSTTAIPYALDSYGALAMTVKDDTPWIMDTEGVLRQFNGSNFIEKARLPKRQGKLFKSPFANATDRLIHYNGMFTRGENIYMLLNCAYSDSAGNNEENIPSGVWCYNELNGLHFVGPLSLWVNGTTASATDFGSTNLSAIGALVDAQTVDTGASTNGDTLVGAKYFKDATTGKNAIFLNDRNDTKQTAVYVVTNKIFSSNVLDTWQDLIARVRELLDSGDKLIVKYRKSEDEPVFFTGTWASTTTFTTSTDISAYTGYELEVLNGVGAGRLSHITGITGSGTYTGTVDETYTGATGTFKARLQAWKKSASFTNQTDNVPSFPLTDLGASVWIQLKVYLIGTGREEIYDLLLSNKVNQK